MTTIIETFGMSDVGNLMISERNYKVHPDYTFANPDLIVGLELEIECWNDDHERAFRGFRFETDGSLRNNGVEAISLPLRSKFVPTLLENFYRVKGITPDNYSERCSTHVHVNAQNLTLDQVQGVCLVYQVLERVLFGFIGNDRDSSIFCVPWNQCNISFDFVNRFKRDPGHTTRNWQKYTALNIIPLRDRGTLEFRHMHGTCDVKFTTTWVNLLGSIVKFATENKLQDIKDLIIDMNTVSNYAAFVEKVFGEYAGVLTSLPGYDMQLASGVIDTKMCIANVESAVYQRADLANAAIIAPRPVRRPTIEEILQGDRAAENYFQVTVQV